MALSLTRASSQYLTCGTGLLVTALPFTVGVWVRHRALAAANSVIVSVSDTAVTAHYIGGRLRNDDLPGPFAAAGGTVAGGAVSNTIVGAWTFFLVRLIAAAERRVHVVSDGLSTAFFQSAVSTVSRNPTGLDTISLGALVTSAGASEFFDGEIAEYWLASGDVIPAGVVPTQAEVLHLALGGPFLHPVVNAKLLEYRSFRCGLHSPEDIVRHNFSMVNSPTLAAHPPLSCWYKRPGQTPRMVLV